MEDKKRYELGFRYKCNRKFYKTIDEIQDSENYIWNLRKDGSLDAYEMINGNSLSKERIEKLEFVARKHAEALILLSNDMDVRKRKDEQEVGHYMEDYKITREDAITMRREFDLMHSIVKGIEERDRLCPYDREALGMMISSLQQVTTLVPYIRDEELGIRLSEDETYMIHTLRRERADSLRAFNESIKELIE